MVSKLTKLRYNTRSNKVRVVKTPGGELRYLHIKKAGTAPKCGDCGIKLPGVSYISNSSEMATGDLYNFEDLKSRRLLDGKGGTRRRFESEGTGICQAAILSV